MKRVLLLVLALILSASPAFCQFQAVWGDLTGIYQRLAALETSNTAVYWEDLRFPSTGINQTGPAGAPGVDTSTFYGSLEFGNTGITDVAYQVQLPHGWLNGSTIYPHIHIVNGTTSTASSVWELWYRRAEVGGDFGSTWTVATLTAVLTNSTTTHAIKAFPAITMTGYTDSCMMSMLIRRRGDVSADAHDGIIRLLEFDIHYQTDKRGSIAETGDH